MAGFSIKGLRPEGDSGPTAGLRMRLRSRRTTPGDPVDIAVRLGDGWQVFRVKDGETTSIPFESAGPEVVRVAPFDRFIVSSVRDRRKVRELLIRELKAMPVWVRRGGKTIACPLTQRTLSGRRVRPITPAIAARVAHLTASTKSGARAPIVASAKVGERLTVMWPVFEDGAVGACEVVAIETPEELHEFAATFAASRGIEDATILFLDENEPLSFWLNPASLPVYPIDGEWFGLPLIAYAGALALIGGGVTLLGLGRYFAGHMELESAHNLARESARNLAVATKKMDRWALRHIEVPINDGAVDMPRLVAAARAVWSPGAIVSVSGNTMTVHLSHKSVAGGASGIRPVAPGRIRRVLTQTAPQGWRVARVLISRGGQAYEVVYEKTRGPQGYIRGRDLPPGVRRFILEHGGP